MFRFLLQKMQYLYVQFLLMTSKVAGMKVSIPKGHNLLNSLLIDYKTNTENVAMSCKDIKGSPSMKLLLQCACHSLRLFIF